MTAEYRKLLITAREVTLTYYPEYHRDYSSFGLDEATLNDSCSCYIWNRTNMTKSEYETWIENTTLILNDWSGRYSYATVIYHACDRSLLGSSWETAS